MLIFISIVLLSCNSTNGETGELKGHIFLDLPIGDIEDHSGIHILLYAEAELDTSLTRLNDQYPMIGMKISQQTEFDHRKANPLYSSLSATDGSFSIRSIPVGIYNIVLIKEGWSSRYIFSYRIDEGENILREPSSATTDDINLLREIVISGTINAIVEVLPFQNCVVQNDVLFLPGSEFIIRPGAVIRINPGKNINIYGIVHFDSSETEFFYITSNDDYNSFEMQSSIEPYGYVKVNGIGVISSATISNGVIREGNEGFVIDTQQSIIFENLYLANRLTNIMLINSDNTIIRNVIAQATTLESYPSIYIDNSSDFTLTNSIISGNKIGIKTEVSLRSSISHNYFDNALSIFIVFNSSSSIEYNYITGATGIENARGSTTTIRYNILACDIGIFNSEAFAGSAFPGWAQITANFNNLYCTSIAVKTTAAFDPGEVVYLDARNNYWNTTVASIIQELIWDKNDVDPNYFYYDRMGYIDYTPFLNNKYQSAGINN